MIHYIKGYITDTDIAGKVVIECGGIGYEVFVPDDSPCYLAQPDELVTIYTYMAVREDDVSLYGFSDKESLSLFKLLQTVSGVGAKAAMAILSALSCSELKRALAFEDADAITKANGVGKKTAQRLVLELKDKVSIDDAAAVPTKEMRMQKGSEKDKALQGLMALGYSKSEALSSLSGITDDSLKAEEYIRLALRR